MRYKDFQTRVLDRLIGPGRWKVHKTAGGATHSEVRLARSAWGTVGNSVPKGLVLDQIRTCFMGGRDQASTGLLSPYPLQKACALSWFELGG